MAHHFVGINELPLSKPTPSETTSVPEIIPSTSKSDPDTNVEQTCPGNQQLNAFGICECVPQAPDGTWFPICNPPLIKDPFYCDCIPQIIISQTPQPTIPFTTTLSPTLRPTLLPTHQPTSRVTPEPTQEASDPDTEPEPEPEPEPEDGGSSSSSSSDEEEAEPNPVPFESETSTTSSTTETVLTCPMPGYSCTNAIPRAERCCDGQIGGRNKCKYNAVDNNGFRTGYCCVKRQRDGCVRNADCCNARDSCINGWCKVATLANANVNEKTLNMENEGVDFQSPHIVDMYNNRDNGVNNESEKLHRLLFTTWTIFFVILIIVLPIMYYWYFKVYWSPKLQQIRTRPRSTSIWENDSIDFIQRESDWIRSDDNGLP